MYVTFILLTEITLVVRVSKESDLSHTPIAVTQTLSSLRLANAQLHEQNSSNLALLHAKEAELQETQQACQKLQEESGRSNEEVTDLKDRLRRADQRVVLAERETGFLQAMMVNSGLFPNFEALMRTRPSCRQVSRRKIQRKVVTLRRQ